jgi:hypothetical protein
MGAYTDNFENALAAHLFGGAASPSPTTWYVGLFTVAPTDSSGGTEVSGGAYARVAVPNTAPNWNAPSGGNGTVSNAATIQFPVPSAGWGTVTSWGLFDAASGGNLRLYAPLTVSKTINTGDDVEFPPSALTHQVDN